MLFAKRMVDERDTGKHRNVTDKDPHVGSGAISCTAARKIDAAGVAAARKGGERGGHSGVHGSAA